MNVPTWHADHGYAGIEDCRFCQSDERDIVDDQFGGVALVTLNIFNVNLKLELNV